MKPRHVAAVLAAATLVACTQDQRQPVADDDGLQLTGTVEGRRISVSDGEPEVTYGDCDPPDGRDADLCVVARSIGGDSVGLVIENPEALAPGIDLDVLIARCPPSECDELRDAVIAELRVNDERHPALSGSVNVTQAGDRYAASFTLELGSGGSVQGAFNVAPPFTP